MTVLRRVGIFILYLMLASIVLVKGFVLPLHFFIFFPLLLLPAYYFYERDDRPSLIAVLVLNFVIYLVFLFVAKWGAVLLFGILTLVFLFFMVYYCGEWRKLLTREMSLRDHMIKELEVLKQKHESRLNSLHHLEKQVAGLLDLFEIARDFGETLGFDKMAEILYKKVLPEMHFRKMFFIVLEKTHSPDQGPAELSFYIDKDGVRADTAPMMDEEIHLIQQVKETRQLVQHDTHWGFPLLMDGALTACIYVEGAHSDDLAKFEVLCAYLALQVKKVHLYETVKELSIRDGLTELFVRRHFRERFDEELKRCIKYQLPLAVLMLDIDHFKRYNDDYGHLAGDATLKQVAGLLRQSLRKVDILARYGGEEFIVVIPETRKEGAFEVAERIRSGIARHNFKIYHNESKVTVSIGVALFPQDISESLKVEGHAEVAAELIQNADKALYRAKEEGRNRVVMYCEL